MTAHCSGCGRFARMSEPFLLKAGGGVLKIQILTCWHCEPGLVVTPQPPKWVTDSELATGMVQAETLEEGRGDE